MSLILKFLLLINLYKSENLAHKFDCDYISDAFIFDDANIWTKYDVKCKETKDDKLF